MITHILLTDFDQRKNSSLFIHHLCCSINHVVSMLEIHSDDLHHIVMRFRLRHYVRLEVVDLFPREHKTRVSFPQTSLFIHITIYLMGARLLCYWKKWLFRRIEVLFPIAVMYQIMFSAELFLWAVRNGVGRRGRRHATLFHKRSEIKKVHNKSSKTQIK